MYKHFAVLDEDNIVKNCYINPIISENEDPVPLDELEVCNPSCVLCYDHEDSICLNSAAIGYTFDENLKAFIPPSPDSTYILNTSTFEWEPDPQLEYDLHGDGKLYRYNFELKGWTPTWSSEENQDT